MHWWRWPDFLNTYLDTVMRNPVNVISAPCAKRSNAMKQQFEIATGGGKNRPHSKICRRRIIFGMPPQEDKIQNSHNDKDENEINHNLDSFRSRIVLQLWRGVNVKYRKRKTSISNDARASVCFIWGWLMWILDDGNSHNSHFSMFKFCDKWCIVMRIIWKNYFSKLM